MRYDLAIIGGGINGAGIARDAALRGLRVALFEREDWGAGTTGGSTRMVHGGLRYLLYDVPTTRHSSEDAGRIRRIAPHLTWRIPFLWPLFPGHRFFHEATEALLAAYDPHARRKGGLQHARLSRTEALTVEPGLAPDIAGAVTLDEWGCDVFRLAAVNALAARAAGADLFAHTEVTELLINDRTVYGVRAHDLIDTRTFDVEAALTINAAGPWAGRVAEMADVQVRMRPGKGVHVTFERRIGNFGVILEGVDGRVMFLVPHGAETIVGTTDTDFYGDPGRVDLDIHSDEVAYVIEATARAMPQARAWRPLRAWAGVRNTLFEWGVDADDLSRRHEVLDHEARDNVAGLLSVAGGKLAAYRIQSEEAVDLALKKLGLEARPGTSGQIALPGAEEQPDFAALATTIPLPQWALERIWRRVGSCISTVFAGATPDDMAPICRSEAVTRAEIVHAVRVEGCRTLEDLRRHAHVGSGGCDGIDCVVPAAHVIADLLQWSTERTAAEIRQFANERWIGRRPVLRGATLAQEEVWRAVHVSEPVT